ncbi:MAG: MBL fold metallo-hydrolase [Deltaproteobacteria bacterium]|nr:MAG: MBL fold metallo-hydrolase [Deltaproteobacteria bacterium]
MKIKWYGHASFLIVSDDGVRIITDPYEPGAYDGGIAYKPIEDTADIVTVSHDHADHNYVQGIKGNPEVVKGPGTHESKGITFSGYATFHDPSQGKERGENTMFVFTVDGVTVCHAGDLGHLLSADDAKALGPIDVLMLPIGGVFTLDPREASEVMDILKPGILIPMHFKTPGCGFPIASVEEFLEGKPDVQRAGGAEITLTKDSLPSPTRVVVLEPAN